MVIYIVAVMLVLYFFVDNMWGIEYDNTQPLFLDGVPTTKGTVYTMLFHSFVLMHLFNEINCRKVGATEFNVFHNITANLYFIAVVGGLFAL